MSSSLVARRPSPRHPGGPPPGAPLFRAARGRPRRADDRMLLRRYATGRDPHVRDVLVERYLPLARAIARRHCHRPDAFEDLLQVACLALIGALDRFDADLGVTFTCYAVPCMEGAIKRYYRDHTWAARVPRDLQELSLRVERAAAVLTEETGRPPAPSAIADWLGVTPAAVREAQRATSARTAESLSAGPTHDDGPPLEAVLGGGDPHFAHTRERVAMMACIAQLPKRERLVLVLRFHLELTQAEIGDRLGVSQMTVSRILHRGLAHLRTLAGADVETAAGRLAHAGGGTRTPTAFATGT